MFCATNGTKRLFVRGRSELEVRDFPSNQTNVVQITNVDYLQPGHSVTFAIPMPAKGHSWRLNFLYDGQFNFLERLDFETRWWLHQHQLLVEMNRLPRHDVRCISTEWIND